MWNGDGIIHPADMWQRRQKGLGEVSQCVRKNEIVSGLVDGGRGVGCLVSAFYWLRLVTVLSRTSKANSYTVRSHGLEEGAGGSQSKDLPDGGWQQEE